MKRILTSVAVCLAVLCLASLGVAKEKKPKPGKLAGTWECISHGSSQGDMPFTLYLEHTKEIVSGSVSSPMGGTQITSASYKKKSAGNPHRHTNGQLPLDREAQEESTERGVVCHSGEKGTWEGKRAAAKNP